MSQISIEQSMSQTATLVPEMLRTSAESKLRAVPILLIYIIINKWREKGN